MKSKLSNLLGLSIVCEGRGGGRRANNFPQALLANFRRQPILYNPLVIKTLAASGLASVQSFWREFLSGSTVFHRF
jgi:hypothetical protein